MLILGPQSTGKTLFTKRLQEYLASSGSLNNEFASTIPTVGTNMTTINLSKRESISMRELGGSMAPIWNKYFKDTDVVIFLADKSNPQQLAAVCVLLLETLNDPNLSQAHFLFLWNKTDLSDCLADSDIATVLDFNTIRQFATQNIDVIECSAVTGQGFPDIISWLKQHSSS